MSAIASAALTAGVVRRPPAPGGKSTKDPGAHVGQLAVLFDAIGGLSAEDWERLGVAGAALPDGHSERLDAAYGHCLSAGRRDAWSAAHDAAVAACSDAPPQARDYVLDAVCAIVHRDVLSAWAFEVLMAPMRLAHIADGISARLRDA